MHGMEGLHEEHEPHSLDVNRLSLKRRDLVIGMTICPFWVKSDMSPVDMSSVLNFTYGGMPKSSSVGKVETMIEIFRKILFEMNKMNALYPNQNENVTEGEILRWADIEADRDVQTEILQDDMDAVL